MYLGKGQQQILSQFHVPALYGQIVFGVPAVGISEVGKLVTRVDLFESQQCDCPVLSFTDQTEECQAMTEQGVRRY